jgi:hypothetical protein
MTTVAELIDTARSYTGVRWRHQGRTRSGIDCAGLLIRTAHDLGLSEFDISGYPTSPNGTMTGLLEANCVRQPAGTEPAPGMVAEIRFQREPQHIALVVPYHLGGVALLHAMSHFPRRVAEHRLDDKWRQSIVALYCLPGVDY